MLVLVSSNLVIVTAMIPVFAPEMIPLLFPVVACPIKLVTVPLRVL